MFLWEGPPTRAQDGRVVAVDGSVLQTRQLGWLLVQGRQRCTVTTPSEMLLSMASNAVRRPGERHRESAGAESLFGEPEVRGSAKPRTQVQRTKSSLARICLAGHTIGPSWTVIAMRLSSLDADLGRCRARTRRSPSGSALRRWHWTVVSTGRQFGMQSLPVRPEVRRDYD